MDFSMNSNPLSLIPSNTHSILSVKFIPVLTILFSRNILNVYLTSSVAGIPWFSTLIFKTHGAADYSH